MLVVDNLIARDSKKQVRYHLLEWILIYMTNRLPRAEILISTSHYDYRNHCQSISQLPKGAPFKTIYADSWHSTGSMLMDMFLCP